MKPARILILEQEKQYADILKEQLTKIGLEVFTAFSIKIASNLISYNDFELAVLNNAGSDPDVSEFCRAVEKSGVNTHLLIFSSLDLKASDLPTDSRKRASFRKPANVEIMISAILKCLNKAGPEGPREVALRAGDLVMNLTSRAVTRAGKNIELTEKEFELLEYLLRNKNRLVSKLEIAIHVWKIEFDTNTNLVEVYINYVRNKVDREFDWKLIKTYIGMGYMMQEKES